MIIIGVVHNTELSNDDYKEKLIKKYPDLIKISDMWKIKIVKLGKKLRTKSIDRLYYDQATVEISELDEYTDKLTCEYPNQIYPIIYNVEKPVKLSTKTATKVRKLKRG